MFEGSSKSTELFTGSVTKSPFLSLIGYLSESGLEA
jgi:hypothetical protein